MRYSSLLVGGIVSASYVSASYVACFLPFIGDLEVAGGKRDMRDKRHTLVNATLHAVRVGGVVASGAVALGAVAHAVVGRVCGRGIRGWDLSRVLSVRFTCSNVPSAPED